jgi:TRAP-type C4-dicarboxylate transport system permease small subunit
MHSRSNALMQSVMSAISKALDGFVVALLVVMSLLVIINVGLRFLFNSSIVMSEEVSRFIFVWVVYTGSIIAMRDDEHIYVDFIRKKMPKSLQKILIVFCNLAMLLCCLLFLQGSIELTSINMSDRSPVAGVPMGWVYASGAVGSAGMALVIVLRIVRLFACGFDKALQGKDAR